MDGLPERALAGSWPPLSEEHVILDLGVVSLSPVLGIEITENNKLNKKSGALKGRLHGFHKGV